MEECDKIVLSSADNERYNANDKKTLAFGHCKIPKTLPKKFMLKILEDPTLTLDERNFVVNEMKQNDDDENLPDPGFLISDESENEFISIPPKRMRKNTFILYES